MPEECGHLNGACYPGHCEVEFKERNAALLTPLTTQQWLDIRRAALGWAKQIEKGEPGPEPLISVIKRVVAEHQTPTPTEPESLSLMGDVIVAEVNECTCGSGGPYPHEPYCGVEPYLWLNKIKNADLTIEYGVRKPHSDEFDIFTDQKVANTVARERKAIVYPRHVLRGRF